MLTQPMRVFVLEYVTGGGLRSGALPRSLIAEGAMMRDALVRDLTAISGVECSVAPDIGDIAADPPATMRLTGGGDPWTTWSELIDASDAVWPVAPETDGALEEVTKRALCAARCVLNSQLDALAVARSKLATAHCLAAAGIPVAETRPLEDLPRLDGSQWVVKPDDGVGASDTLLVDTDDELARWREAKTGENFIAQPFISGPPLSISMLAQGGMAWLLSCNHQHIACHGGAFSFGGIVVGGAEHRRTVLEPLARRIAETLPGLWGYVGVDLIDSADGPVVLEINPRLTTSYIGLSESLDLNCASLVLELLERPLASLIRPLSHRAVDIRLPRA